MGRPRLPRNVPFDLSRIPSSGEVGQYEYRIDKPCCTWEDFRPDLNGTPTNDWNRSVVDVFKAGFMRSGIDPNAKPGDVERAFATHLRSLIAAFRTFCKDDASQKMLQKLANANERRRTVRHSHNYLGDLLNIA